MRARGNPVGKFTVYHGDHGITPEQKDWIKNVLYKQAPQGFFNMQVDIPAELGTVKNALYGPASGDPPVPESAVSYRPRGDRPWSDRVVNWPTREVGFVQTIGKREGDDFELWTIFGGPNAPRNPGDPNNPDPEGSRNWWSQHALSIEQWETKKNPKGDGHDDLRREYAKLRDEGIRIALKHKWTMTRDPELLRKSFDEMVENVRRENGIDKTPEGYVMAAHWALNMIKIPTLR